MKTIISKDGTRIAFDQAGSGPAVILTFGAFSYRKYPQSEELMNLLANDFTVINYDRRGRGDSGDTKPYAVQREIEDLDALIQEVGGSACVFGLSSGAVLALKAAAQGSHIRKLALYGPPLRVDTSGPLPPSDFLHHLNELIAADKRSDAVHYFMTKGMGAPGFAIRMMRFMPGVWPRLKAVANTLPYDAAILEGLAEGKPIQASQWAAVTMPTLVMGGGKSPASSHHTVDALTKALPNAQQRTLPGLSHTNIDMKVIAPELIAFFKSS